MKVSEEKKEIQIRLEKDLTEQVNNFQPVLHMLEVRGPTKCIIQCKQKRENNTNKNKSLYRNM